MKKFLTAAIAFSVMSAPAVFAATTSETNTTYTEQFIQKHTQRLIDAEKKLQEKQQQNEEQQKAQQEAWEQKKLELQKQHEENVNSWNQKKQDWEKQQQAKQAENELIQHRTDL